FGEQVVRVIKEKRFELLMNYYIWFTVLAASFFGIILAFLKRKINQTGMLFGFLALLVIDLYLIDIKFINPIPNNALEQQFQPDATVQKLQAESDTGRFRVLAMGELFQ